MNEVELYNIGLILTFIVGFFLSGSVLWKRVKKFIKELSEFLSELSVAIEDDRLTKDEIISMLKIITNLSNDLLSLKNILWRL